MLNSRPTLATAFVLLSFAAVGFTAVEPVDHAAALSGSWEAHEYSLAGGVIHPVRGRIVFTADEWQVLFFVMDGDDPLRGSGEGGRYTFDGETLIFEHLFHLSAGDAMDGLPASPLALTARAGDGPLEPTGVEVDGDALRLLFPSGNTMSFRKSSEP